MNGILFKQENIGLTVKKIKHQNGNVGIISKKTINPI